jgi:hypothetical protein
MIWPTNYDKLAAATMFTLFFGGDDFAPHVLIEGEPAQAYLQRHFIDALKQVARRVQDLPNVAGFDSFNEPSLGYIGLSDLNRQPSVLRSGPMPTPFEGMVLGAGHAREVDVYAMTMLGSRSRGRQWLNARGVRAWRDGCDCLWKGHGVWDVDADGQPRLLQPDYFARANGRAVDRVNDYLRPFIRRYAREIQSILPRAIIFAENVTLENSLRWGAEDTPEDAAQYAAHVVNAAHWYDGLTIYFKEYRPYLAADPITQKVVLGAGRARQLFVQQLRDIKQWGIDGMSQAPTLIGEFGLPFDLKKKQAYRTGNYGAHIRALDSYFAALDANLLSGTLWNYTPDNTNARGDQWNDEDFSIFSRDQQTHPQDINSGGRALEAVVRPYARATAGEPLKMSFDRKSRTFEFEFRHASEITALTEIFLPNTQYPHGYHVDVSDGAYEIDRAGQLLIYRHSGEREVHRVRVRPAGKNG